jgi:hypothetical protein
MCKLFIVLLVLGAVVVRADTPTSAQAIGMPPEVRKEIESYVGKWKVAGTADGSRIKGRASYRLSRGEHCVHGDFSAMVGETQVDYAFITGWDSTTEWYTEHGIDSTGEVYTIRYKRKSPKVTEGEYSGTLLRRKTIAKIRIERNGQDEFTVTVTEARAGDYRRPDWVLKYSRIAKHRKCEAEK